jgi:hypothetical protein
METALQGSAAEAMPAKGESDAAVDNGNTLA